MQAINPVQQGLNAFQTTRGILDQPRQVKNQQRAQDQQAELNEQRLQINELGLRNDKRGQLKSQAQQEWQLFDQGVKPFSRELHEELLQNDMGNFSPYSLLENSGNALKFGPALAQMSQGNMAAAQSPEALSALNEEYATQIKKGVGERHQITGQVVTDKQIVGFQPVQGGKIVPVVRSVFENGESYDAPMTMNRSSDPNDPVEAKDAGEMMDEIMSRYQLAKLSQDPGYREKLQGAFNIVFEQKNVDFSRIAAQLPEEGREAFTALAEIDPKLAMSFAQKQLNPTQSSDQVNFQSLTEGLSPEDIERSKRIKLGLDSRAGSITGKERIATDEDLTQAVAKSAATVKSAEKRAEGKAKTATDTVETAFKKVTAVETNIRNIDRAIGALNKGAKTGAVQKFLPSITAASRELDQIRSELGLDVVGSVTFGALSEGELNLALDTALPTGLDEGQLKEWLITKKSAQKKLVAYLDEQIQFLEADGTVGEWRAFKQGSSDQPTPAPTENQPQAQQSQVLRFDAQGNLIE